MTTTAGGRPPVGGSLVADDLPRILVVDDEKTIVFAITRYFGSRGFQADGAFDCRGALRLLKDGPYELVIVDLRLEGLHDTAGFAVVEFVRRQRPETKIVVLTAYSSDQIETEAARRGVDVVLRKPTALPDLAQVVMGLVAGTGSPAVSTVKDGD